MLELDVERLATDIAGMERKAVIDRLLHFEAGFPMDFTREYLERLPPDRLGHLLLAAHLYCARRRKIGA